MAYSAEKNSIFFERLKNYAVAKQNLREEGQRLRDQFLQEVKPGGVENQFFADTPIATKAESISIIDYISDFKNFNESGVVGQAPRSTWILPLVDTTPAR